MMNVKGINYYLRDDCDTLICKLENQIDDFYYNDTPVKSIDNLEYDLETLENAVSKWDYKTMQIMLDKYHTLFKRYR